MKCYLDRNQIERLASDADVYRRGIKYFRDGNVSDVNFVEDDGGGIVEATVYGNYSDYRVNAAFDKNGILKKYGCTCEAFGIWRGGCKHVVATLLRVFELNQQNAIMSKNLRASRNLLGVFEKLVFDEIGKSSVPQDERLNAVSLEPTFCCAADGECFLTFKIGRNKKYVVKDVGDFLYNLQNERVVSYGKDLEFQHMLSLFDEQSEKLARFIIDENSRLESASRILPGAAYIRAMYNDRRMPLTPQGLDKFFSLYLDRTLNCQTNGQTSNETVTFLPGEPPLQFEIKQKDVGAELYSDDKSAAVFKGENGSYIMLGDKMYYAGSGLSAVIVPIFETLRATGGNSIFFPDKETDRLACFLIPKLKEFNLLKETDAFKSVYARTELKKRVYLDMDGKTVLCNALCRYGDTEEALSPQSDAANTLPAASGSRNIVEEHKFRAMLTRMGFIFSPKHGQFTLTGDDAVYNFNYSENGLALLKRSAEVFATEAFDRAAERRKTSTKTGVRINGGLLEISIDTEGYLRGELLDILQSYRVKKKYHRLKDGGYIDFDENTGDGGQLGAIERLFNELLLTEKDMRGGVVSVPKYRAVFAGELIGENPAGIQADLSFRQLVSDFKAYKDLEFDIPEALAGILRGYQKEGFRWLKVLSYYGFGGVLADDMGLGKTLQVITVLLSEKADNTPSIVVAPTSLIYNWEKEILKFAPSLNTHIIAGVAGKRKELFENSKNIDVYITTYDTLKRDIDNYANINFRFIIADEAQNIKNPATQNAKALKALKGQTKFALTGTPIENSLSELWSIFDFIMPGYLHSSYKFTKSFETPIIKNDDQNAAQSLRKQIAPFILRRLKSDVLTELPQKIETTLYAEMPPEQKKLYTAYLLKAKGELDETIKGGEYNKSQIEILSKLTRLRQICCHPAVFAEGYKGGSGKLDLTLGTVASCLAAGHRILIFSQFTKMLAIIKETFDRDGIEYFYLDGATPSRERLAMADEFNGGARDAFLISLKAGGTGLNLTGADIVIHYDPWWNPAVMEQASDRAHRIGQSKTVQVINIVAKDSIEEKIMLLQAKKKDLFDTVIEEGVNFINKMTEADIVELFK